MALRFFLMSVVAGLGCELPSKSDLAAWTKAGRCWVDARLGDLSVLKVEAERAFAGVAEPEEAGPAAAQGGTASARVDLAFEAVVEKMATDFAADLASIDEPEPAPVTEALVIVEPFREMPPAAWTDPEPAIPAFEEVAEVVGSPGDATTHRAEKLAAALRLTRQAVSAWGSLIQPPVRVAVDQPKDSP